jgi:hypothetical protein
MGFQECHCRGRRHRIPALVFRDMGIRAVRQEIVNIASSKTTKAKSIQIAWKILEHKRSPA